MKRYLVLALFMFSVQTYAQGWWTITYHQGSGANSNTISRDNNTYVVNTDVPPPSEEMKSLNPLATKNAKAMKKRLKKMNEERQLALQMLEDNKTNDNGVVRDCPGCSAIGIQPCSKCSSSGLKECSTCSGKNAVKCHACNGVGTIRDVETCLSCKGSGTVACNVCMGSGKKVCTYCVGLGVNICGQCKGAGRILEIKTQPPNKVN